MRCRGITGKKTLLNLRTGNTTLSQPGRLSGGAKPLERQIPVMISTEHEIAIAIRIAIKNRSGKIADRFSYQDRSAN
jgi:hypothetical protein